MERLEQNVSEFGYRLKMLILYKNLLEELVEGLDVDIRQTLAVSRPIDEFCQACLTCFVLCQISLTRLYEYIFVKNHWCIFEIRLGVTA